MWCRLKYNSVGNSTKSSAFNFIISYETYFFMISYEILVLILSELTYFFISYTLQNDHNKPISICHYTKLLHWYWLWSLWCTLHSHDINFVTESWYFLFSSPLSLIPRFNPLWQLADGFLCLSLILFSCICLFWLGFIFHMWNHMVFIFLCLTYFT